MATTNGKDYIDFDMEFTAHPTTGDLVQVKKNNVINRQIQNIVKTAWYERLMQPDISGGVGGLLFENFGPLTDSRLSKAIENSIAKFVPMAQVQKVKVIRKEEQNAYQIYIEYLPDNSTTTVTTEAYLERA
tara:strand:- start:393 stop:785 length:393 start_codon:yes stop_codon:yes gene_type:complete